MRKLLLFVCLIIINSVQGQVDSLDVFIPKDDGSPYSWETKHLWTKEKTHISFRSKYIKIWADNAVVDNDSILPIQTGVVRIYGLRTIEANNNPDTIVEQKTFVAIDKPTINARLDEALLKDKKAINLFYTEGPNNKKLSERYEEGRLINDILILDSHSKVVFTISFFTSRKEYKRHLLKGRRLRIPAIAIRDKKTDLLIWTKEFEKELE